MKYELMRKGNIVFGRVLEQDESTRSRWEGDIIALYNDDETGMKVRSSVEPALMFDAIYLRGYKKYLDNNYNSFELTNECEAKEYYNQVKTTLEHCNEFFKDNAVEHDDINTEHITAKTVGDPDILLVEFVRVYEKVLMKILFQDKEITGRHKSFIFNRINVSTCMSPVLGQNRVWLRGDCSTEDNNIVDIDFNCEQDAIIYFNKVCDTIAEYVTACQQDESEQNQYNGFDDYCIIGG